MTIMLPGLGRPAALMRFQLYSAARLQRFDIGGGKGIAPDTPLPTGHVMDANPGDATHVFAFDGDHGVGDLADHLLFVGGTKDAFYYVNVD